MIPPAVVAAAILVLTVSPAFADRVPPSVKKICDGANQKPLGEAEKVMHRSVIFLLALVPLAVVAEEPDAITQRVVKAKEEFRLACQRADEEMLGAIDEQFQSATSDGDFQRATKLNEIKDAFEFGFLPKDDSFFEARMSYNNQFGEAREAVEKEFEDVVSELTETGDLARASEFQSEKKNWLEWVKTRKTPTTRVGMTTEQLTATPWKGHRYKVFKETLSWHEAEKRCKELGGHLIVINNKEEQSFVVDLLSQNGLPIDSLQNRDWAGVWLGASDEVKEGEWKSVDGVPLAYDNWSVGTGHGVKQPNGGPGSHYACLGIHYGGEWDDRSAVDRHVKAFICEWD